MLYEMLTGRKPFDGENPVAIALKHMQETAVSPREIMPSIPEALEEIVIHAMERDPARRYQSAAEMIRDIDTFKLNQSVVFGYKDAAPSVYEPPVEHINDQYDDYDDQYDDDDISDDEDEDDEEDEKKRSYVVPILLAVTVAVVIIAAFVIGWVVIKSFAGNGSIHTGTVTLPNFVGKNIVQVEQDWKDKLKFDLVNEYNDEYDEGIIFWQSQSAGKSVKEGYTLTIKVSKGKQMTIIPDMNGSESEVAQSELKAAGFTVVLRTMFDDSVAEGLVIKTEPAAGKEYPVGGSVTVFVSKGPVDTKVKVPDVVGMTKEKAIAALKENKLTPKVEEIAHEGDKGKVVDQSIDKGEKVDRDTEVTIYVSTGETDPVDLTIALPMPTGIHGSYSIEVYKNGNVAYTQPIASGETVAGSTVNIDITGKKKETLTISIRNNETGRTVNYAVYDIDYDEKTVKLNGSLNESGLLDITPTTTTTTTEETTTTTTTTTTQAPVEPPQTENTDEQQ